MPAIRFSKAFVHWFRKKMSPEHKYLLAMSELVHSGDYEQLRYFLEEERNQAVGSSRKLAFRRGLSEIHEMRVGKDYEQFFGTFSNALSARLAYQDRLIRFGSWLAPRQVREERRQALIERSQIPTPLSKPTLGLRRRFVTEDRRFERVLAGKRVIVIGPSPAEELRQEMVDRFDVVVAPKLYGESWLGNAVTLSPEQMVVTYFNHGTVERLNKQKNQNPPRWDFCRVKSGDDVSAIRRLYLQHASPPDRVGLMASPDPLLNNYYGPFMGTAMLYDLLLRRPAEIFLTGFTFFAQGDAAYRPTYDSSRHSDDLLLESLRVHGAFSNFLFVKNLFNFKMVQADETVAAILSLTPEDYARELDERFLTPR